MHAVPGKDRTQTPTGDPELEKKVKKACERISENLHIVSNEPSLACYRLQEHIRKSLPYMVEKRFEVAQVQKQLQGKCYDLEYSISAVKSIEESCKSFQSTQELMKNAMFMKQQLAYEESLRHTRTDKKTPLSMYQRFSGSFDMHSSFLQNTAPMSSSASASGDFRGAIPPNIPNKSGPSPRRARASSVSSSPYLNAKGINTMGTGSVSASNSPKHVNVLSRSQKPITGIHPPIPR